MPARILIVDDNPLNLKLARLVVLSEGHEATVAAGAEEALSQLERSPADVILMDLQMPGTDGLELTRMLKGSARTRHIPVLALTASAMTVDQDRARAAGCDGFIAKPLDTRAFATQIGPYLPETAGAR